VRYKVKLDDPSLTKLPPRVLEIAEQWVKYEDAWYFDVATAQR
jgi:hypothetical protein